MLYVICLSGSIAVLSNEIDWLLNPKIKSQPGKINWDLVYSKFKESYPNYELTTVRAPRHSGFAAQSYAKSENGKTLRVYSNPVSGEVQTLENFWNTQRFFRSFHRRFFILPGKVGILFVSLYAIPLIILVFCTIPSIDTCGILFGYPALTDLVQNDILLVFELGVENSIYPP